MNLIEEYTKSLSDYTDAPLLFVKASAFYLISTLCGAHVRCFYTPDRSGLMANEWFLISGLPLITRKSTIIKEILYIFKDVYRQALQRLGTNTIDENSQISSQSNLLPFSQRPENQIIGNMIMEAGTPEGIMDRISKTYDSTFGRYTMVSSEWGGIIEQVRKKDYLSGYRTLLSKLYYGEEHIMDLSSRSLKPDELMMRRIDETYVTALVGMQEPHLYFEPEDLMQGLLRRFIIIHCTPQEKEIHLPWLDLSRKRKLRAIDNLREAMLNKTIQYFHNDPSYRIEAIPSKEVINQINDLSREGEERLKKDSSLPNLYKQGKFEHVLKLAIINAIASKNPIYTSLGNAVRVTLPVDEQDLSSALRFYDELLLKSEVVITSIKSSIRERSYLSADGILLMIQTYIHRAGTNGITVSQLLLDSRIFHNELKQALITLLASEKIIIKGTQKPSGDFDMIIYDSSFKNKISTNGYTFDYLTFGINF